MAGDGLRGLVQGRGFCSGANERRAMCSQALLCHVGVRLYRAKTELLEWLISAPSKLPFHDSQLGRYIHPASSFQLFLSSLCNSNGQIFEQVVDHIIS